MERERWSLQQFADNVEQMCINPYTDEDKLQAYESVKCHTT
jgi:hypothetical protein